MKVTRLSAILVFSLLAASQAVFLPDPLFAWTCCDCSVCHWKLGCVCPGTPGLCGGYACRSNDSETTNAYLPSGEESVDLGKRPTEKRTISLTKREECAQRSFISRMLGNARLNAEADMLNASKTPTVSPVPPASLALSAER